MRGGGRAGREGREKRRRERRGRTSPGGERGLRRKKRRLGGKRERCWQPAGRGCCWDEGQSRGAGPSEVPDAAALAAPFPISWHGGAQIHAASTVCLNPQYQQPPSPVPPALWCMDGGGAERTPFPTHTPVPDAIIQDPRGELLGQPQTLSAPCWHCRPHWDPAPLHGAAMGMAGGPRGATAAEIQQSPPGPGRALESLGSTGQSINGG